jgi:lysophospholipase L1-like esterase
MAHLLLECPTMTTRPLTSLNAGGAMVALAGVTALAGLWRWGQLLQYVRVGEALADDAKPFEQRAPLHAPAVLVVGDSTAVGTGATTPRDSIAGLLGAAFPHVSIVNRAVNGARTLDVIMQLAGTEPGRYDLVLVHAGGNDVLRRTPLRALEPQVDALMRLARKFSSNVIVTTIPNIGLLPLFFPPLSWMMSRRSRQLCALYAASARKHGALYLDFFHERGACPLTSDPERYFARDGLHPSNECYKYVFEAIMKSSPLAARLTRPRLRPVRTA